ncbi:hypothetical protein B9Q09_04760, partial [Candidatus Marsarchaeota G2 archaeon ECH_B_SAG-C16]
MSYKKYFYPPAMGLLFYLLILLLLIILVPLLILGVTQVFKQLGFTPFAAFAIIVLSLAGSAINIPVFKIANNQPIVRVEYYTLYGVTYPVPSIVTTQQKTVIAVNAGGALIPASISAYLWYREYAHTPQILLCILLVTLVCYKLAKPVEGVGIVMPAFIPPIVAAVSALVVSLGSSPLLFSLAYISGSLGTLIGADLLNLRRISRLRAQIVSIGGAGTFDGIFISGILAVVIAF